MDHYYVGTLKIIAYIVNVVFKNLTGTYLPIFCALTKLGIGMGQRQVFMQLDLHNTCHFNLTDHFQNWSLAKIKVPIVR